METRANYALIGLFTLTVFAGMLGFVYWFAAARNNGAKVSYQIIFTGSVSGLSRGALVRFNGLRVGEVTTIDLMPDDPSRVVAVIEVDQKTPVKTDTRARLEYQGLTGQASVQLSGGTAAAPALVSPDGSRPLIYADRSDFQDILETVQRLAARTDGILTQVEKVVVDNEAAIGSTIRSVEVFARALADNSAGVGAFLGAVGDTAQRISSLSTRLETLSTAAEELVRGIDAAAVNRTVANVETFSRGLAENRRNIDAILTDGAVLARRLSESSQRLDGALSEIDRIAKSVDGAKIGRSIDNIDRFAQILGSNTAEADRVFKNAADISTSLRAASTRVEEVLVAAQRFLGSATDGDSKGAFGEVAAAARSVRELADDIKGRTGGFSETAKSFDRLARSLEVRAREITTGINRLTTSGGRDIEALAADARRAANEVNRAVRNLSNDPSQIIRGGRPSIPEYSGQR